MRYDATVLADSIGPTGVRVITIQGVYPRFIHPEVLRARVQSHSVMSSRAVPTEKLIELVRTEMFIPETFNARVKGMGFGDALDAKKQEISRLLWLDGGHHAADIAERLVEVGIDKSRANRLLEPFLPVVDIITATEWSNFLALRQPPEGPVPQGTFPAQPEFQIWARMVREAIEASEPRELGYGEWHMPKIADEELLDIESAFLASDDGPEEWRDLQHNGHPAGLYPAQHASAGRVARASYATQDKPEGVVDSWGRAGLLVNDAHWSPLEHVCRPLHQDDFFDDVLTEKVMVPARMVRDLIEEANDPHGVEFDASRVQVKLNEAWCGNLRSFVQLRKLYELEHDRGAWMEVAA